MEFRQINYSISRQNFGSATTQNREENKNNMKELFPGAVTGLATGGTAYAALGKIGQASLETAARDSFISRQVGKLARTSENIFNQQTLNNISSSRGRKVGAASGVALATFAAVTGVVETFKNIFPEVSKASNTKGQDRLAEKTREYRNFYQNV